MKIHELCLNTIRRNKHLKKLNNSKKKKKKEKKDIQSIDYFIVPALIKLRIKPENQWNLRFKCVKEYGNHNPLQPANQNIKL